MSHPPAPAPSYSNPSAPSAPSTSAVPASSLPDFALFTPAGNEAVARLLTELVQQQEGDLPEAALLHRFRCGLALLGLQHPEVYDTAVREELWAALLARGFSEAFSHAALIYAPAAEILFGLSSPSHHQPGETLAEMHQRRSGFRFSDRAETAQAPTAVEEETTALG